MKHHKAFTLIEILVVMSLIAIFVSLLISQVTRTRNVGDDTNRAALVRSVTGALESHRSQFGSYPSVLTDPNISKFQTYTADQLSQIRYVGFDLDGEPSKCEAYSVSTEMNSSNARELQHDDDRAISFSATGTCRTPDTITTNSCLTGEVNTDTCVFGKPLIILPNKTPKADWILDISNLPQ